MLSAYPACFYKESEGGYSVIFPDLNHLATQGETLEEAFAMAIDCLAGYLYECKLSGDAVPAPTKLQNINPDDEYDEYEEAFVNIVTVDVEEYARLHFNKAVKKTLTIPQWLNDMAMAKGVNFSGVLQRALMNELNLEA